MVWKRRENKNEVKGVSYFVANGPYQEYHVDLLVIQLLPDQQKHDICNDHHITYVATRTHPMSAEWMLLTCQVVLDKRKKAEYAIDRSKIASAIDL